MSSVAAGILHQSRSLYLRRTVPNDATLLFEQAFTQREFMRLFRLNDTPANAAEVHRNLVGRQQVSPGQDRYLELLILHKRHGPIGLCALADYAPLHRRAEFLIGLFDQAHRYVGYGLEASLMVLDLAFNTHHLHKVYASTYAYNHFAQKGLTSLGFQLEGVRQEHVFDQAEGRFTDLHDYGMTVTQFRNTQRLVPLAKRLVGRDITQPPAPQESLGRQSFVGSGPVVLRAPP